MKKLVCFVVIGMAASPLLLTGCGADQHPAYSPGVKYGLRTDPVVTGSPAKLGEDRHDPDRPGVLPLMKFDDILKPDHPMNAKADTINDTILRDPMKIAEADRQELEKVLEEQFGTPANPTIKKLANIKDIASDAQLEEIEENESIQKKLTAALEDFNKTIEDLKLDDKTLAEGSTRYRVHCLHCHGVPGDGRGPTARWINPHPRDFRAGLFKFQSVDQASDGQQRAASRADLERTLRNGIEGTAMPSFGLLSDRDIEVLISYVMHLSVRGNAETDVIKKYFDADKATGQLKWNRGSDSATPKSKTSAVAYSTFAYVTRPLKEGNDPARKIKVEPYPYKDGDVKELAESIQRGQQLFLGDPKHPRGKDANCKQCHDDYGRQARFKFDEWGTLVRPNNFTQGVFRGGKRPVDIYYRVHSGINGSGMTNFGKNLQGRDIWDLVNFVTNLSYPAMHKDLGIKIN